MSETNSQAGVRLGQRVTLEIQDIAFGGEGVGRFGELVVFVPFVMVGETVEAEVIEAKRRFARARLLRVLQPSPERVDPRCSYFGICGGCQYQHINYSAQLKLKHKQIRDLFARMGGFPDALIHPVRPCPKPYGYRNRIMVRSQWNKPEQRLNIGFLEAQSRLVVDVLECPISEPALNEQLQQVRTHPPPKGGLKVVLRIQPEGWQVPHDSFFQNNFFLLPELVGTVRARLQDAGVRHLVDVYCGVGFFGIELADAVESFAGVELDRLAIRSARENARLRGVTNGEFLEGRAEEQLPKLLEKFPAAETAVLMDPPRTGCPPETFELLQSVRPAQVIYVSCHPATLARDLRWLCAGGVYELQSVTPLDMFPHTQHVECVADLRLRTAPPASGS